MKSSPMTPEEETEVLSILNAVGVTLTARPWTHERFVDHYSGNYTWDLSNGWNVTVFCDCGEWDYIDNVEAADGRQWDYPHEPQVSPMTYAVADWQPSKENQAAWGVEL